MSSAAHRRFFVGVLGLAALLAFGGCVSRRRSITPPAGCPAGQRLGADGKCVAATPALPDDLLTQGPPLSSIDGEPPLNGSATPSDDGLVPSTDGGAAEGGEGASPGGAGGQAAGLGTTGDGGETSGGDAPSDGSAGDGPAGDGPAGGPVTDGAADGGAAGDGPADGAVADGAAGDGALADGAAGDDAMADGTAGDSAAGDGALAAGSTGGTTVGDGGAAGDSGTADGALADDGMAEADGTTAGGGADGETPRPNEQALFPADAPSKADAGPPVVVLRLTVEANAGHGIAVAFSHVDTVNDVRYSVDKRTTFARGKRRKDGALVLPPIGVPVTLTFKLGARSCRVGPVVVTTTASIARPTCE